MSSFVRLMSVVGPAVGDALPVAPGGVHESTMTASAARSASRGIREQYGREPARVRLARGGGHLRRMLRLPLRRRRAEALVVDVLGDGGGLAADRALRSAAQLDLAERGLERVEQEVTTDERLADPEEQLDGLVRLQRPDD